MPATFKTGGAGFWIKEGRYRLTLRDLSDETGEYGPRVKWVFTPIVNAEGEVVTDDRGFPLEYFEWTGQSIGERSNAKPIAEALLGKSVEGIDPMDVSEMVIGKSASAMFADTIRQDGTTISRTVKGSWKPLAAAAKAPAGQARPAGRPAPVQTELTEEEKLAAVPF